MMMFQDHNNQIREQEIARLVQDLQNPHRLLNTVQNHELPRDVQDPDHIHLEKQQEDHIKEAKEVPESLPRETLVEPPTEVKDQEASQEPLNADAATQSQPPMPSDETMRHSIADSLMEILVNMTNPHYRRECLELLEASDPLQARGQILNILQRIDVERSSN